MISSRAEHGREHDSSQDALFWRRVGEVVTTSAEFSWQLLLLASALTGDPADFDKSKDKTLGVQLDGLLKADRAANGPAGPSGRYGYTGSLIDLIELNAQEVITYRNRIVHDTWSVVPSAEHPDAVEGQRPTSTGRRTTKSTVRSFEMIGLLFAATAGLTSAMQLYVRAQRRMDRVDDAAHHVYKARKGLDYVRSIMKPENGWLWNEASQNAPGLLPVVPAFVFVTPTELAEEAERAQQPPADGAPRPTAHEDSTAMTVPGRADRLL